MFMTLAGRFADLVLELGQRQALLLQIARHELRDHEATVKKSSISRVRIRPQMNGSAPFAGRFVNSRKRACSVSENGNDPVLDGVAAVGIMIGPGEGLKRP